MIKTLTFGDKQVSFSTNFAWCFIYRSQFHRDPAQVVLPVARKAAEMQDEYGAKGHRTKAQKAEDDAEYAYLIYELLGFTEIASIAWSMARLVDNALPDPITWIGCLGDDFNAMDILLELIPEAIDSCFATKKSRVPSPTATKTTAPAKK